MSVYEEMLAAMSTAYSAATPNAEHEVAQQIALAGLHRGGFFQHAAFYGGTCLRIFHGLPRFSEDMDFSLIEKRGDIHIEDYFQAVIEEFRLVGREVEIVKKEKKNFGRVESAFLKDNTETYMLKFQAKRSIKVKIELDIDPPLDFDTEQLPVMRPYSFMVRCFTLPCLFAGKMHALLFRSWKHRVKGRDWYDFEWYVRHKVPLDFRHFQARCREFGNELGSIDDFKTALRSHIEAVDMAAVRRDVMPFVIDAHELDIWSREYFTRLVDLITVR